MRWPARCGKCSIATPERGSVPNPIAVLVVDDDAVSRAQLSALVRAAGYEVRTADHGREAWDALRVARIPVVISDWYMPELDGPELCRRIRARPNEPYVYFILVTARGGKEQYLAGMEAGADDFVAKPVDPDELRARLTVAQRILGLRRDLQQLEGLLPICTYCKQIRDDSERWGSLESYIEKRSDAQFSHGICPDCYAKYVQPQLDRGIPRP
jgi:DNA-binding response OmpR family regulator